MASLAASYSKWDHWNDESDDDTVEVRDGAARLSELTGVALPSA